MHGTEQSADGRRGEKAMTPRHSRGEGRGEQEAVAKEGHLVVGEGPASEKRRQCVVLRPSWRERVFAAVLTSVVA